MVEVEEAAQDKARFGLLKWENECGELVEEKRHPLSIVTQRRHLVHCHSRVRKRVNAAAVKEREAKAKAERVFVG